MVPPIRNKVEKFYPKYPQKADEHDVAFLLAWACRAQIGPRQKRECRINDRSQNLPRIVICFWQDNGWGNHEKAAAWKGEEPCLR